MLSARHVATCLLVLGAIALAAPAVTVAAGGGSAGDQQYTDPFASSTKSSSTKSSTATPAPAPTTTSAPAAPATAPASATTPTATIATPTPATASTTSQGSTGRLPYTGYDSWMAGALGVALVGGGLGLRRRARRA